MPECLCCRDVGLLASFGPAAEQDHQPFTIPAKVNAIARTEVQPQLLNTRAFALHRRNITPLKPVKSDGNACLGGIVQLFKPSLKGIAPQTVNVLANLNHKLMVAQKIL